MSDKKEVAVQGIVSFLSKPHIKENIECVVGKEHAQAFISDIVSCVQNNNMLSACTHKSIMSGALVAKSIKLPLSPHLGYTYLVPFDNKKIVNGEVRFVKEAQFQMGYKGYVQLALRSGRYKKLLSSDVRRGEIIEYNPFDDSYKLQPIPFDKRMEKDGKGNYLIPISGYYAKFELDNGFVKEMFMTHDDMVSYAKKYSKSYRSDVQKHTSYSFWTTGFVDMAMKTMIRKLLGKWGLLTTDLEKAYVCDMAVIDEEGNPHYVDNQPDDVCPAENPMGDIVDVEYSEMERIKNPDCFN